jgi:hypothetical protein
VSYQSPIEIPGNEGEAIGVVAIVSTTYRVLGTRSGTVRKCAAAPEI